MKDFFTIILHSEKLVGICMSFGSIENVIAYADNHGNTSNSDYH